MVTSKSSELAVVLRATLVVALLGSLGATISPAAAQGKSQGGGKPPAEPVNRYMVHYMIDPGDPFNFMPDDEGLFGGGGCTPPDCPYVDWENGFVIDDEDGSWRQVQQFDRDLDDFFGGTYHYRYFWTDIEDQALEENLCPELIDLASGWTLGGSHDHEILEKVRFSLWLDPNWTTGWALVRGMAPVKDGAGSPVWGDFDDDGELEELLDAVSPGWDLVWDPVEFPGSSNLLVTPEAGGFRVQSPGKAMLRITRPGGRGQRRDCGLVDARFELVATLLP